MNAVKETILEQMMQKCLKLSNLDIRKLLKEVTTIHKKVKSMTIQEAAKEMGKSESFVRIGLQRGRFDFGIAEKLSSKYTYYISPEKFYKYIGRELPEKYK